MSKPCLIPPPPPHTRPCSSSTPSQVCTILPANPSTRTQWKSNQCVTVGCKSSSQLVVTSRQSRSTPGIYTEVWLRPQTSYRVEAFGQSLQCAKAFVFVYDPSTKCRLIPNYSLLPNAPNCSVCAEFTTPCSSTTNTTSTNQARQRGNSVCVWLGALFTGPPRNGQQFCLQSMKLSEVANSCTSGAASHHAVGCSPVGCVPPVYCCSAAKEEDADTDTCSDDDSTSSSCSDDDYDSSDTVCHHHQVFNMNEQDPYFTYGTQPAAAPPAPPAPPAACSVPNYSPNAPSCVGACPVEGSPHSTPATSSEPLCISDLQSSLGTLIKQMKG